MATDAELLRSYARDRSETAFTELVQQHIDLVYSAALREAHGDAATAEDITQAVFVELARKASNLVRHPALAGWLYTCVRQMTANMRRAEDRRLRREQEAHTMKQLLSSDASDSAWRQIQPVLDDAMHELSDSDRTAVVLRFFEERSLKEIGLALGLNENAARMRVDRALEKLQKLLAKRGVTSTAAGLTAAITASAVLSAPSGLAASVATCAIAAGASTATATFATLKLMTMSKLKAGIVAAVAVAGVATTLAIQHQTQTRLRAENQSLRERADNLASENTRLSNLAAPTNSSHLSKDQFGELMRLRGEVNMLRKQLKEVEKQDPVVHGEISPTAVTSEALTSQTIPKESWAFAGYATPEAALQSVAWAMSTGNVKTFFTSLSPETQREYARRFEGKSDDQIAALLSVEISPLQALRLDRKKISPDGTAGFVLYSEERDDGTARTKDEAMVTFTNIGGSWKLNEPNQSVTEIVRPATGE
ncbi:MAG TPA: sigma-70 family RNA polymerase sigma factor [Candidatus Angelobacter sp.]|nr:sigma-70 family RNA polymerase sigma factor [Candidatus Angelobacter sp.]